MANEDVISKSLGLRPLEEALNESDQNEENLPEVVDHQKETLPEVQSDISHYEDTITDIELAKNNIQNIIKQGDDSLGEMIELAKQSESPRAFEVAANLMKTLLDANKDYVEMSTRRRSAIEEKNTIGKEEPEQNTNITNNNLIISTADLLNMLKGEKDD